MARNHLPFHAAAWAVCLGLVSVSPWCFAEVYKWVDANGQTHYSGTPADAGKSKVVEMRLKVAPAVTSVANDGKRPAQVTDGQLPGLLSDPHPPQKKQAAQPIGLSDGHADGSNASRCNLAKDVLSGAVKHTNGAPTDKYDIQVAQQDVRAFCH